MPLLTQGTEGKQSSYEVNKTNWKFIAIIIISAVIIGGGILGYQYGWLSKKEVKLPKEEPPKEKAILSDLNLKTTKLAVIKEGVELLYFVFSPNGRKVAYIAKEGNKEFVVLNGEEGKRYDLVRHFIFSPDSQKFAYFAKEGNKQFVVLNGQEGKRYDFIDDRTLTFSPDSQKLFYLAKEGDKYFVVLNGEEGKRYDEIYIYEEVAIGPLFIFSPDSQKLAYIVKEGDKYFVVLNGQEGKRYDFIVEGSLTFSPDSQKFAYIAIEGEKDFVVLNGEEGKRYDLVRHFIFSPDSQKFLYIATEGNKEFPVLNGQEGKRYDKIVEALYYSLRPAFSPDSQKFAYIAKEGNKKFVVLNGQEGKRYDEIWWDPVFSPDSQKFAYLAIEGNKKFVVLNGQEGKRYDEIWWAPIFSPDSQKFAYIAIEGEKDFVVLNGEEGKRYDYVPALTFSPDSQKFAYIAKEGNKKFVVLNGQEGKRYYDYIRRLTFSPDSKYLTYGAKRGNELWWIVEETEESEVNDWKTYSDDELGISFSFPSSWSSPDDWQTQIEPTPFWIMANPYDKESDGLIDWVIPGTVKKQGICESLAKDENVYLSWRLDKPYICKSFKHPQGPTILYGIGIAWYFEGADYLSPMIIILQDERFILMYRSLTYSTEIQQLIEKSNIEFSEKYPGEPNWFGHPFIAKRNRKITELLIGEITLPSPRITETIQVLEKIVKSINFK